MRWEDERYVRLYTRDTTTWLMLPWQSRFVVMSLLRKVDRAGTLDLGDDGIEGLAAVLMMPLEIVDAGVAPLARRGTIVINGTRLVIPNFLAAQECAQTDKARKRAERERARAKALESEPVTKRDIESQNVTESHAESHDVTAGHTESQPVTPCLAVPCLTVPSHTEEEGVQGGDASQPDEPQPSAGAPPATPAAPSKRKAKKPKAPIPDATEDELAVFTTWQTELGHPNAKLDAKRLRNIRAALASHGMEMCRKAIRGMASSLWHRENRQDDIELILRDASHIEKYAGWIDKPASRPAPPATKKPTAPAFDPMPSRAEFEADAARWNNLPPEERYG